MTTETPITTTAEQPIMMMETPVTTIKEKPPLKLRHELKHRISYSDDQAVTHRLRKLFRHDANADSHGIYRVSSLYFDTPYDKALRQKIDGVDCREKFRIRYYGLDTSFLRLEKKFKIRGLCGKHSLKLTEGQVRDLLHGNAEFLLKDGHPLGIEFYSKIRGQLLAPTAVVTYEREAFLYEPGNVRVTVDRNLRAASDWMHFLDPGLLHFPVSDGLAVLEVKYDAFLPEIVAMAVQVPNRQAAAYSKYAICRRYD